MAEAYCLSQSPSYVVFLVYFDISNLDKYMLKYKDIFLGIRKNEDGVPEDEENFDEAVKNVNSSLHKTSVC